MVPIRATAAVTPRLAETSPDGRVRRSGSRRLRLHSRSNRTDSWRGPRGSWVCDPGEAGTAPSIGRGSVAAPAANHVPGDSPAGGSAASTHRAPDDSRTSCLRRQNTAQRGQIPGDDGGQLQKVRHVGSSPTPQAQQSPLCPPAHSRCIRRA